MIVPIKIRRVRGTQKANCGMDVRVCIYVCMYVWVCVHVCGCGVYMNDDIDYVKAIRRKRFDGPVDSVQYRRRVMV